MANRKPDGTESIIEIISKRLGPVPSVTAVKRHMEQFERTKRWLERVKSQIRREHHDAIEVISFDEAELFFDDVHAFFQNCWHMKDWIKHDDSLPQLDSDIVDTFVG